MCSPLPRPTYTHKNTLPSIHKLRDAMFIMLTIPRLNTIAKLCQKEYTN